VPRDVPPADADVIPTGDVLTLHDRRAADDTDGRSDDVPGASLGPDDEPQGMMLDETVAACATATIADAPADETALETGSGTDAEAADDEGTVTMALDEPEQAGEPTGTPAPRPTTPRDARWYTDLVRTHQHDVHRYLVRRAGQDADDLTADVLTIAWRRRDDVPEGAELPWLYRTAGFVLANHRRKGRPVPVEHLPEIVDDDDPALRAVHDERVRTALAALSPRDRKIVLLNAWEGLTGQALADVLGIGRGGADAALSRARARLAAAWTAASD